MRKHKKKSSFYLLLQFVFIFSGILLLITSIFKPWAYGRSAMGLIHKSVYAYNEPALFWPFCLLCALILITAFSGFYSFATNHNFIISGFIFLVGLIVLVSGLYLWLKIDDNDVYLVLKLVEIHPDNGILFIVIGGVVLAIGGLLGLR